MKLNNDYSNRTTIGEKKVILPKKELGGAEGGLQIGKEQFITSTGTGDQIFTLDQLKAKFSSPEAGGNDLTVNLPSVETGRPENVAKLFDTEWLVKDNHTAAVVQTSANNLSTVAFDFSDFLTPSTKMVTVDGKEIKPENIVANVETGVIPENLSAIFDKYWNSTTENHITTLVQTGVGNLGEVALDFNREQLVF